MLYEHYRIDTIDVEGKVKAEIYCRYCNQNVYFPKKGFVSKEEAYNDLIRYYGEREEHGMNLHLMMCKEYGKYLEQRK